MISGSSMNQLDLPRPVVRLFETSSRRKEIRLVDEVIAASQAPVCIAAYSSLEGVESVVAPAACSTMSISRLPPRTFRPFASGGLTIGVARLATPPACQIQDTMMTPLLPRNWLNFWPTCACFQAPPCL